VVHIMVDVLVAEEVLIAQSQSHHHL